MRKPLIVFGLSSFAEIVVLYFSRDSEYEPILLCADDSFVFEEERYGLPVKRMSWVMSQDWEQGTYFHVAASYPGLNRLRRDRYADFKRLGLEPASYVSSHSYVDDTAVVGDHAFIFEHNTVQPYVRIGSRCILWSGNHIGHHSVLGDDVFVSSHVVISGHCVIGDRCFLGVNSTIANNLIIGSDNWLQPQTAITRSTGSNEFWHPVPPAQSERTPIERFVSGESGPALPPLS